jgi:hypothetical protein
LCAESREQGGESKVERERERERGTIHWHTRKKQRGKENMEVMVGEAD